MLKQTWRDPDMTPTGDLHGSVGIVIATYLLVSIGALTNVPNSVPRGARESAQTLVDIPIGLNRLGDPLGIGQT